MTPARARELVNGFRGKQVLLVGDLMMDEWVVGSVKRISPEAPIAVVAIPSVSESPPDQTSSMAVRPQSSVSSQEPLSSMSPPSAVQSGAWLTAVMRVSASIS